MRGMPTGGNDTTEMTETSSRNLTAVSDIFGAALLLTLIYGSSNLIYRRKYTRGMEILETHINVL